MREHAGSSLTQLLTDVTCDTFIEVCAELGQTPGEELKLSRKLGFRILVDQVQ